MKSRVDASGLGLLRACACAVSIAGLVISLGAKSVFAAEPASPASANPEAKTRIARASGAGNVLLDAARLLDLGEVEEARKLLLQVVQCIPAEREFLLLLESRIALAEGRYGEAAAGFAARLESRVPAPAEVFVGALLGAAEVLEKQGESAAAARKITQFLKSGREIPIAEPLFQKVAMLLSESLDPNEGELRDCTKQGPVEHQALARFYLGQFYLNLGKGEKCAEELRVFCEKHPEHRLRPAAFLRRAEVLIEREQWVEADKLLSEAVLQSADAGTTKALWLRHAQVAFKQGAFPIALARFTHVLESAGGELLDVHYNAGLTAIRAGDFARANVELQRISAAPQGSEPAAELELEIALYRVALRQNQAEEALLGFIRNHPGHPRLGDARVALAEFYSAQAEHAPADSGPRGARALRDKASGLLRVVSSDPQSPKSTVQARYLAVFLADAGPNRNDNEALQLGEAFLKEFPNSPLAPEVRMKCGELYFRRRDCANAEFHFATVASQWPESPLAETALLLAGQCASSLLNPGSVDRALAYWDKVASGNGALRWKARYQEAAVKCRIGDEAEGVVLFDVILKAGSGVPVDLRLAAQCGKADAMLAMVRRKAASEEEVVREYQVLAESPEATPVWRNQALYKIAKIYEPKAVDRALEAFEKVLAAPGTVESGEFFWSFKAGFDAARLHENQSRWRQAIGVYEKLSAIPGPRAAEARARAQQLRLEQFLWD